MCWDMGLSKIESDTLVLLANHGPLSGYDLHSKKKENGSGEKADTNIMSDVYWLKVKKKMENNKLIKEYPEEGRRKPYKLAEDGFDYILQTHFDEIHDFNIFAENYREYFPLVLGCWEDLKDYGLDDYVVGNLVGMIKGIYVNVFREIMLGWRQRFTHQEFIENLYIRIYVPELFHHTDKIANDIPLTDIRKFRKDNDDIWNFIQRWKTSEIKKTNKIVKRLENIE